jgi:hypothetical protein
METGFVNLSGPDKRPMANDSCPSAFRKNAVYHRRERKGRKEAIETN